MLVDAIDYPESLPISERVQEIRRTIVDHPVTILCGETGSGKSTQLPKICLQAGLGSNGRIGHTQPRRLAARSVAARIADELSTPLGNGVGFQIRFGDQTSDDTIIKLMTDGILLAEIQSDPDLRQYDGIIVDEAHERSLNIDFLLGYLRTLLDRRPEFRVVITSATIDAQRFAEHFGSGDEPAPVLLVEGRGYPVEMRYLPWEDVQEDPSRNYDLASHVMSGLDQLGRSGVGDTLVFLPTERDIRMVSHRLAGHYKRLGLENRIDLLPLYARLPQSQQQRIFRPEGKKRRIILATNVAESSLTVPGIHAVIDSGTARISRYATRSRVQRLPIEPISKASANQRAGRCGRVGPGVCVRLYGEEDFDNRPDFTTPEIRRTNLASVVLQMRMMGIEDLEAFPLLDPPRREAIRQGFRALHALSAVDAHDRLTPLGRRLGRMPVDPRIGRILVAAEEHGCLPDILPIAASLEVPDPRVRPPEHKAAADQAHAIWTDPRSDFITLWNLWHDYTEMRTEFSRSKVARELKKRYLSPTRMQEWWDVHRQLREAVVGKSGRRKRLPKQTSPHSDATARSDLDDERYAAIHRSLLTGFTDGVAQLGEKKQYTGAGGLKLTLWPGSGLYAAPPKWIVAAEVVETSNTFARTVAKIQPAWIEQTCGHLLKKHHADPHWSDKSGAAFCYENQTLYGLPVVVRRRVPLAPIDPTTARDLLIEHGLVQRKLRTRAKVVRHNRAVRDAIASIADKTRRRDAVIDDFTVARFYHQRLPMEVCDEPRLSRWDRDLESPPWAAGKIDADWVARWQNSGASVSPTSDLGVFSDSPYAKPGDFSDQIDQAPTSLYPDEIEVSGSRLPLKYRYAPGEADDGVDLTIHVAAVPQLSDERLDWLVPGMLSEKILAMIKSMPKRIRRNLVPAADIAERIAEELSEVAGRVPFEPAVFRALANHAEMPIGPDDIRREKLSEHLRMHVTVVDDDGNTVGQGRSLAVAKSTLPTMEKSVPVADADTEQPWRRSDMQTFDIEHLPPRLSTVRGGVEVTLFPGLRVRDGKVGTKWFTDRPSAEQNIHDAVAMLYHRALRKPITAQVRHLPSLEAAKLKLGRWLPKNADEAIGRLIARVGFVEGEPVVRTADAFESRRKEHPRRIQEATIEVSKWLDRWTEAGFDARRAVETLRQTTFEDTKADVSKQIDGLLFDSYLDRVRWKHLQHYPRYFAAIAARIEKRSSHAARDAEASQTVRELWKRFVASKPDELSGAEAMADGEARWMFEELRVSLFAQHLGTDGKISPTRIEKKLGR